jgi:hypothetical protein
MVQILCIAEKPKKLLEFATGVFCRSCQRDFVVPQLFSETVVLDNSRFVQPCSALLPHFTPKKLEG